LVDESKLQSTLTIGNWSAVKKSSIKTPFSLYITDYNDNALDDEVI